ncbi:MAG: HNH endonuclease [Candidatus Marinimicrobia bacterium]|nr:HNH endonuclease [Candidatus Neomarinimicrobiota bacterium]
MTKVEAIIKVLEENNGIANWNILYNNIEKFYPKIKNPKDWKAGVRGVLYRELDKKFKMIDEGLISLIDYDEVKLNFVEQTEIIDGTTKTVTLDIRKGQNKFRKKLFSEFVSCPITGINDKRILIASHIKPWALSNNFERLDKNNGFIFSPTIDKLFDLGLITFDTNSRIIVSSDLSSKNFQKIKIDKKKEYPNLKLKNRIDYIKYHQNNIFIE